MMPVFTDEYSHYVAKDKEDLRKLLVEEEKIYSDINFTETDWIECHPDRELTIIRDVELPKEQWVSDTKTIAEWEKQNGRGFLCSTEW